MRIITLNVNGVRSAANKGLFRWLAAQRADVICLQGMKCQELDLDARLHGYSGIGLLSRKTPDEVRRGFASKKFDTEGRYVEARSLLPELRIQLHHLATWRDIVAEAGKCLGLLSPWAREDQPATSRRFRGIPHTPLRR